ncbi:MAG: hypothetical protein QXJ59_00385 [Thermofilaceae archaeon]
MTSYSHVLYRWWMEKEERKEEERKDGERREKKREKMEKEEKEEERKKKESEEKEGKEEGEEGGEEEEREGETERGEEEKGEEREKESKGEEEGEEIEEGKQQGHYEYNADAVVEIKDDVVAAARFTTLFYRFIAAVGESSTHVEYEGGERYSTKKLLLRSLTREPLPKCKARREREGALLLVDTSGSMRPWEELVLTVASAAKKRGDLEVFEAPNGFFPQLDTVKNRVVIYIGDFDGGDTPVRLSWKNRVYWFCTEQRYRRFRSHGWMNYDESDFKGMFFRVHSLDDFCAALRIALGGFRRGAFFEKPDVEYQDD